MVKNTGDILVERCTLLLIKNILKMILVYYWSQHTEPPETHFLLFF